MKRHLKGFGAPKAWSLERKRIKYIAKPAPGPHKLNESITINFILINLLKLARTSREVKKLLSQKLVFIDNIPRTDKKFPLGLMDTLSIPSANLYFRIFYSKNGRFILSPIKKEEAEVKPRKIIGKRMQKKNKLQINFYDGTNILSDKKDYKIGDTIIFQKNKIKKHIPLKEGVLVYISSGKYIGNTAKLQKLIKFNGLAKDKAVLMLGKNTIETAKDYIFPIDKELVKE